MGRVTCNKSYTFYVTVTDVGKPKLSLLLLNSRGKHYCFGVKDVQVTYVNESLWWNNANLSLKFLIACTNLVVKKYLSTELTGHFGFCECFLMFKKKKKNHQRGKYLMYVKTNTVWYLTFVWTFSIWLLFFSQTKESEIFVSKEEASGDYSFSLLNPVSVQCEKLYKILLQMVYIHISL